MFILRDPVPRRDVLSDSRARSGSTWPWEVLGGSWVRKFGDVGAEDGAAVPVGTVLRSKSIPVVITAPGRAGPLGPARRLGAATNGSANGFDAVQRDAAAPREGPARCKTRRLAITREPSSRSPNFTARLRLPWVRAAGSGATGGTPAGLLARARVTSSDITTDGPLFLFPAERRGTVAGDERRGAGRGPGNGIESEPLPVPPMTPPVALVTAHSIGWVSRRWRATSRTRWRSCTLTGPRGSSLRCTT